MARGRPGRAPPVRAGGRRPARAWRGHPRVQVAYETWGRLNERADNAILVEHALTGDSHVVGPRAEAHLSPGWWDGLIGPGRPLDTDRWFVVASNVLGGCQGTTGPSSLGRRRATVGEPVPVRDRPRPGHRRGPPGGRDRGAAMGGGPRRVDGRHARPRVGGHAPRPGRPRPGARQHGVCVGRPDRLGQPQLLAIRSDPDFLGGDYYDEQDRFAGPETGWASPGGSPT